MRPTARGEIKVSDVSANDATVRPVVIGPHPPPDPLRRELSEFTVLFVAAILIGCGTVLIARAPVLYVIVGVLVHEIPRRRRRDYGTADLAVFAYAVGVTLIPVLVLLFSGQTRQLDT